MASLSCDATVITALYNCERYLEECVRSVQEQTLPPNEHIIVDDCSTDGGYALAQRLAEVYTGVPIRVLHHETNRGFPTALNTAIAAAQTRHIAILDSDDASLPEWLERVGEVLRQHPDAGAVGGAAHYITEDGTTLCATQGRSRFVEVTRHYRDGMHVFTHPGTVLNRACVISIGGYDRGMLAAQDFDLLVRMAQRWPIWRSSRPLIRYRIRADATSGKSHAYQSAVGHYVREKARLLRSGMSSDEAAERLRGRWDEVARLRASGRAAPGAHEYRVGILAARGSNLRLARRFLLQAASAGHRRLPSRLLAYSTYLPLLTKLTVRTCDAWRRMRGWPV